VPAVSEPAKEVADSEVAGQKATDEPRGELTESWQGEPDQSDDDDHDEAVAGRTAGCLCASVSDPSDGSHCPLSYCQGLRIRASLR
jgi:hypothetical protein